MAAIAAALVSMAVSLYMAGRYMPDGYTLLQAAEVDNAEDADAEEQEVKTTETLMNNENKN